MSAISLPRKLLGLSVAACDDPEDGPQRPHDGSRRIPTRIFGYYSSSLTTFRSSPGRDRSVLSRNVAVCPETGNLSIPEEASQVEWKICKIRAVSDSLAVKKREEAREALQHCIYVEGDA